MKRILLLAGWLVSGPLFGQAPNLGEAAEIARAEAAGREFRILQIPRRATALIPLRFLLQEAGLEDGSGSSLQAFDFADYSVLSGKEAALAYTPHRAPLFFWGTQLAETRETFRMAGTYQVMFGSAEQPELRVAATVEVSPFRYLNFGEEFLFFVAGCLVLGGILLAVIVWLHRRSPPAAASAKNSCSFASIRG
jgi:hypothetical protein